MRHFLIVMALGVLVLACSWSCKETTLSPAASDELQRLEESREKWQALGIDSYGVTQVRNCAECSYFHLSARLTVIRDSLTQVVETGQAVGTREDNLPSLVMTIDTTFDWLESILRSEPSQILVEYDSLYSFPALVSADLDADVVDDEFTLSMFDFNPYRDD